MKRLKKIALFVGLILLTIVFNLLPMLFIGQEAQTPVAMKWVFSIGYLVLVSLLIFLIGKRYRQQVTGAMRELRFTWKDFGIALLFFLATRVVAVLGTMLVQLGTGNTMSANDAALFATSEQVATMFPLYFITFHVAIGLFAPFMEELVFRGFFSQYFFKTGNKWLKLVISSSIFALFHIVYPIEFVTYFALGAIFYLAYARRGSIKDAIAVHILNNSLLVLFSVINYLVILFG
ncbi:CPBP family intramembrane glutamic endopeptidase [Streptococcus suis]|uniref:CPBP family intramembrane metalloprotease n=1 Tax=Streptococcus suis TaxID=1307 RepID=A0A9X4RWK1_STRSU|nr:type II CAAX endopeptidase family protein [Streptococcus suis]MBY5024756.1 CPBP family intramembrane metalloprotease [Streptococcus suis]MDG4527713.1 CPBP family intramembrane metalloprotease [Streptococcus suis]MDG4530143.1 CPBP family intramembrane metalloprotease [Streptococcus suis]QZT17693.1 CPBP family intramembrane metalloprotease [Streptococcus suis]HEM3181422.1 CPBP family intramembrane metalloprotease [Streptococcus suis 89-5259]